MKRILLCEDDMAVSMIISRILAHAGYEVATVETAEQALTAFEQGDVPDLLVSDVMLPTKMSGFDLACRAIELVPPVPVILLTGYDTDPQTFSTRSLQDVILLRKPVARLTLLGAVETMIGNGHNA